MILGLLLAAAPTPTIAPVAQPPTAPLAFTTAALHAGRTGDAAAMVCAPFAMELLLCYAEVKPTTTRFLSLADGLDANAAATRARTLGAEAALAALTPENADGFARTWWLRSEADGLDHLPLLYPDELTKRLGGPPTVATPNQGTFVAWVSGDADFDKMVAVGVRKMYDTLPQPVSPDLYTWDGLGWKLWGVAKPTN